eukprot:170428_1
MALNKVVMGDMKDMGKSDIHNMLKKGAISMFLKDAQTNEDIKKFADADIEDILATRTEQVTHEDDKMNDPDAAMFSEAVFVANEQDAEINVEDENFWEVLGVGQDDDEEQEFNSPFHRRRRTRLQSRTAASSIGYDSDGFSVEEEELEPTEEGETLLGCLSYIIYGKWQQIFDEMRESEKRKLKLIGNDDEDDESEDDDISNN